MLPEREPFYLWPDNVETWHLFLDVQTQWRGGFGGREGLDYDGVEVVMRRRRIPPRRRDRRFSEIQVMERAALAVWRSKDPE